MKEIEKLQVVDLLGRLLEEHYVLPLVGKALNFMLQQNYHRGRYHDDTLIEGFIEKLTRDVLALCKDKHFKIIVNGSLVPPEQRFMSTNFGFEKFDFITTEVAYLKLSRFCSPSFASQIAHETMGKMAGVKHLIIDVRKNGGGHPDMVKLITSYFFDSNQSILLNTIHWRDVPSPEEWWTETDINSYPDLNLYVLTSRDTLSAAEEFCYNLQCLERAVLIGEVTGGAAHPCRLFELTLGLSVAIPVGKAVNPISNRNWEQCGVIPDIATNSEDALKVAFEKIGLKNANLDFLDQH
ncbi:MAG: S41 family peptidase [Vibrio sp.]|uniref:S41 family peptidase n=1 Tax=Vibrio sp. TaxID=678 RepID=UPI001ED2FB06|nr:S41 family peptidase [Vibrio sp.]NRB65970.1 S41 family peptidase [Vibrio sp.]